MEDLGVETLGSVPHLTLAQLDRIRLGHSLHLIHIYNDELYCYLD